MNTTSQAKRAFLSGDEALARGAFEAGVKVACAYPGTPSTEIVESLSRFAQVDTQRAPPGPSSVISAHRMAALKKCTDGIAFESDKYVNCMTAMGENP